MKLRINHNSKINLNSTPPAPSPDVKRKMEKKNDDFCRHLINDNVLRTRQENQKEFEKRKKGHKATLNKKQKIWDYPAMAVTSFDIHGKYAHSNYSRSVYHNSYNELLRDRLNSLDPNRKIGQKRSSIPGEDTYVIGHCAEPHAANQTMNDYKKKHGTLMPLEDIFFSPAKRPRTMEVHPPCINCRETFDNLK